MYGVRSQDFKLPLKRDVTGGTSLAVQWLRLLLPVQGVQV